MSRIKCLIVLLGLPVLAGVLPQSWQEYRRVGVAQPSTPALDEPLWREYGFQEGERGDFQADAGKPFTLAAWRFADATGAIAVLQYLSPPNARSLGSLAYSAALPDGGLAAVGNYVVEYRMKRLSASELRVMVADLPEFRPGPMPSLPGFLPVRLYTAVRYVVGKQSLSLALPGWSAERFGIDLGAEAQVARTEEAILAVIRYPTPHIARQKASELSADKSILVRRSGPLVAVVTALAPGPLPPSAEPLADAVEYRAILTENEQNPNQPVKDAANMMLSIFTLAGGLMVVCLGGGLLVGGLLILGRRGEGASGGFQGLNLGGKN